MSPRRYPCPVSDITAVILAGGRSSRFGGDPKALQVLAGRRLVDHVIDRIKPQADCIVISANDEIAALESLGLPVIPDTLHGYLGPLAGILGAMDWQIREHGKSGRQWLASVPVDGPFLPADLVSRLAAAAAEDGRPAIAGRQGRLHPVFGLWPLALRDTLEDFLLRRNGRRLLDFTAKTGAVPVSFDEGASDPFININTPADLDCANMTIAGRNDFDAVPKV